MRSARAAGAVIAASLAALLAGGCARLVTPARPRPAATGESVLAAMAARERAMRSLRVSMRVRTTGPGASPLAAPAYLAVDGPERLRLQVLSPFGMTVLDLAIEDDAYTLQAPMRGEVVHGRVDVTSLQRPDTPPGERMIVALALLFRPRLDERACRVATGRAATTSAPAIPATITCPLAADLAVTTTLDDELRAVHDTYTRLGGDAWLEVEYDDYPPDQPAVLPGSIVIRDPAGDASLTARVQSVRSGDSASR